MSVLPPPYEDEKNIYCLHHAPRPNGSSSKTLASQTFHAGLKFSSRDSMASTSPIERVEEENDPLLGVVSGLPPPRSIAHTARRASMTPLRRDLEAGHRRHDDAPQEHKTLLTVRFPLVLLFRAALIAVAAVITKTGCWPYSYYGRLNHDWCRLPQSGKSLVSLAVAVVAWNSTMTAVLLFRKVRLGRNGGKQTALVNFVPPAVAIVVDMGSGHEGHRERNTWRVELLPWVLWFAEVALFIATCVIGAHVAGFHTGGRLSFHAWLIALSAIIVVLLPFDVEITSTLHVGGIVNWFSRRGVYLA